MVAEAQAGRRRGCARPGGARRGGSPDGPDRAERCHPVAAGDSTVQLRVGRGPAGQAVAEPRPGRRVSPVPSLGGGVRRGGGRRSGATGLGWSGLRGGRLSS